MVLIVDLRLRRQSFIALCVGCMYIVLHTLFVFPSLNFDLLSPVTVATAATSARPFSHIDTSSRMLRMHQQREKQVDVCIAVITGYSDVPRKGLVVRLLKQIVEQLVEFKVNFPAPMSSNVTLTLSVFCQGACKDDLLTAVAPPAEVKAMMSFHEILLPLHAFNKLGDEGKAKRDYNGRHIVISWNYRKVCYKLLSHSLYCVPKSYIHCAIS